MNIKELEQTVTKLKQVEDRIRKISSQIEAVLRDKVMSIDLTFKVEKHKERKATTNHDGDLVFFDPSESYKKLFQNYHYPNIDKILGREPKEKEDEVKLSVNDSMFIEIMTILLRPRETEREAI